MALVAEVTIQSSQVSADLTDFPVYIDLSDLPLSFWDVVANGGGDIRCFKSDGTTELAREVVTCDTATDTGELHVLYSGTTSSSVDTVIQIHADGTSADYAVGATYGRNAVWSDYDFVWHGEVLLTDSTGNNTITSSGSPTKVARGYSFDGISDSLNTGYSGAALGTAGTVFTQVRYNADANPAADRRGPLCHGKYGQHSYSHNNINFIKTFYVNDGGWKTVDIDPVFGGVEYFSVGVADGTNVKTYINGSQRGVDTAYNGTLAAAGENARIAIDSDGSGAFAADIYSARIRVTPPTNYADWIAAEQTNQTAPGTFYTTGAVSSAAPTLSAASASAIASTSITPNVTVTFP